jgi:DNA-binding NarL/FixJ family response regulator
MRPTLLVIDDHAGFRAHAREFFEAEGFTVVGEAADAEAGIEAVRSLRPDIVLLDVRLPGVDGVEASRRIAALNGASVVVLTSSCDVQDLPAALADTRAAAFIPKWELSGEGLRALLP